MALEYNERDKNKLLTADQISTIFPHWIHPVIPGHAVQGSLLMTTTDFVNPPQSSANFRWMPMEELVGVHDIRLDYDEADNNYTILKSYGHLNNDNEWIQDWYPVGTIEGISPETEEALRSLEYVSYRYDTTTPNTLKVYGKKKDATEVLLCNISFVSKAEFDTAITEINDTIAELELKVESYKPISGVATEVEQTTNGRTVDVLIDGTTVKLNIDNELYSPSEINDLVTALTSTWSSSKIVDYLSQGMNYRGTKTEVPTTGKYGDVIKVGTAYYICVNDAAIPVTYQQFTQIYTAGTGIDITNGVISASGVAFGTGNGLEVVTDPEDPETSILQVKAGNNITFRADKTMDVSMAVDNETVELNSDLEAKVKHDDTLIVGDDGLRVNTDNTSIIVNADEELAANLSKGLTIDANGIAANVDNVSVFINSSGQLTVPSAGTYQPSDTPISIFNLTREFESYTRGRGFSTQHELPIYLDATKYKLVPWNLSIRLYYLDAATARLLNVYIKDSTDTVVSAFDIPLMQNGVINSAYLQENTGGVADLVRFNGQIVTISCGSSPSATTYKYSFYSSLYKDAEGTTTISNSTLGQVIISMTAKVQAI